MSSSWEDTKEMGKIGFDEAVKVVKGEKSSIDAAKSIKEHGEKIQFCRLG